MAARFWVTGGNGNWSSTTNWSATSGGASGASVPGSADTATFNASSGAGTATLDISPTIQTLTMSGFTGTLAFGTNSISLNTSGTVYTGATSFTVTGTPVIYLTYSGANAITLSPGTVTESNSISFIITAGTYALGISNNSVLRDLDFSNSSSSTFTGVWGGGSNGYIIYGNLTLKSGMTVSGTGIVTLGATSGTKTITSAGVTMTCRLACNGVGGTWQLQDALNVGANQLTLTNGTFDANNYNVTAGRFDTNNTNTRTLNIGSGTWTLSTSGTGNTTAPWVTSSTIGGAASGLTVTGSGTLSFTGSSSKNFSGGSISYSGITLNQGGAGTLTINASNTFKDITATYIATAATTILLATGTHTVSQFTGAGSAAKLLTLNSSIAGTQRTLTLSGGGTVSTDYLSVQDIAFTPGPAADGSTPYVWYLGANSTNSGNNTGGLFQAGGTGAIKVYQITNTATTSWTVPSDWNSGNNTIYLIGGGGGGGGARTSLTRSSAGGGGGGGYTAVTNFSTTPSSSITVAIGTGGNAGTSGTTAGNNGSAGTSTTWNSGVYSAGGGGGGGGGTTTTATGGTAGTGSTYNGGGGGIGLVGVQNNSGGGGGGGAGGPNGDGTVGGSGNAGTAIATGGGGGGNGGGSAGSNASTTAFGAGGNNFGGTGGGATVGAAGTVGGGGAGAGSGLAGSGGAGGAGIDILNTIGGGGGGGGTANAGGTTTVRGGLYGGGGSGGGTNGGSVSAGYAGAQGLIVIAYTPGGVVTSTGNFFLMFT